MYIINIFYLPPVALGTVIPKVGSLIVAFSFQFTGDASYKSSIKLQSRTYYKNWVFNKNKHMLTSDL